MTSKTENVAVSSVASIADKADDSAVVPATDTPAVPAQVTPEPQSIVSTIADITGAERRYLDQAVAMRCGVAEPANTRVQVLDFNRDGRRDFLFVSGQSAESECRGNAAYVILALSSAEGTFEPTLLDGAEMIDRQTLEVTDKRCDGFIGRTQLRWAEPEWSVVENCVPLDIGPDPAGFEEEGHDP